MYIYLHHSVFVRSIYLRHQFFVAGLQSECRLPGRADDEIFQVHRERQHVGLLDDIHFTFCFWCEFMWIDCMQKGQRIINRLNL